MRILELTYHFLDDFDRIILRSLPEAPGLLEHIVIGSSSGHRYGFLFVDMGPVADALAYWRSPGLYEDRAYALAHGMSREHALELAHDRLEKLR